jgi:hypothetical protein
MRLFYQTRRRLRWIRASTGKPARELRIRRADWGINSGIAAVESEGGER